MDSEFSKSSMCVFPLLARLLKILNYNSLNNQKKVSDMYIVQTPIARNNWVLEIKYVRFPVASQNSEF